MNASVEQQKNVLEKYASKLPCSQPFLGQSMSSLECFLQQDFTNN
jgi:hypothetical protein